MEHSKQASEARSREGDNDSTGQEAERHAGDLESASFPSSLRERLGLGRRIADLDKILLAFDTAEAELGDVWKRRRWPAAAEVGAIVARGLPATACCREESPSNTNSVSRRRDLIRFGEVLIRSLSSVAVDGDGFSELAGLLLCLENDAAILDHARDILRGGVQDLGRVQPTQHYLACADERTIRELRSVEIENDAVDESLARSSVIAASVHGLSPRDMLPVLLFQLGIASYARNFGLTPTRHAEMAPTVEEHVWGFASMAKWRLRRLHDAMMGSGVAAETLTASETLAIKVAVFAEDDDRGELHPVANHAIWLAE